MMFTPIVVTTDTDITPKLLRHIDGQYDALRKVLSKTIREDVEAPIRAETRTADPSVSPGRLYYNTATGQFRMGLLTSWKTGGGS